MMYDGNGFSRSKFVRADSRLPLAESAAPRPLDLGTLMPAARLKQLRAVLIGVGIVFFLGATYTVAMKGFGRALDRHWSENVGYPGVEDAYKRDSERAK